MCSRLIDLEDAITLFAPPANAGLARFAAYEFSEYHYAPHCHIKGVNVVPDNKSNNERGRPKIGFMLHNDYRRQVIEFRLKTYRPGQYQDVAPNGYRKLTGIVSVDAIEAQTIGYIKAKKPDVIYLEYNLHHGESAVDLFRPDFFTLKPCRNRTFVLVTGTAIPEHVIQQLPRNVVTSVIGIVNVDASFDQAFDEAVARQYESRNLIGLAGDGDDPEGQDEHEGELNLDVHELIQNIGPIDGPVDGGGTLDPAPVNKPKRGPLPEEPPRERLL